MSENFEAIGRNAKGEEVASNGTISMEFGGRDAITINQATDREIDANIKRTNSDGTDWKIVYDTPENPSTYFLAARAHGYFGMGTRAVIVPLSQLEAWQRGVIQDPPRPRNDHIFDNKAAAFDWLHTLTPSIKEDFMRDRNILVPSAVRATGEAGMQSLATLRERVNPFR